MWDTRVFAFWGNRANPQVLSELIRHSHFGLLGMWVAAVQRVSFPCASPYLAFPSFLHFLKLNLIFILALVTGLRTPDFSSSRSLSTWWIWCPPISTAWVGSPLTVCTSFCPSPKFRHTGFSLSCGCNWCLFVKQNTGENLTCGEYTPLFPNAEVFCGQEKQEPGKKIFLPDRKQNYACLSFWPVCVCVDNWEQRGGKLHRVGTINNSCEDVLLCRRRKTELCYLLQKRTHNACGDFCLFVYLLDREVLWTGGQGVYFVAFSPSSISPILGATVQTWARVKQVMAIGFLFSVLPESLFILVLEPGLAGSSSSWWMRWGWLVGLVMAAALVTIKVDQWFSKSDPCWASSASPWNLAGVKNLGPLYRCIELENTA